MKRKNPLDSELIIIQEKAKKLGIILDIKRNYLVKNDIYIESLYIPNHLQGKGLGTQIMNELIKIGNKNKIPLTLESSESEENSDFLLDWYFSLGFDYQGDAGDYGPYLIKYPD